MKLQRAILGVVVLLFLGCWASGLLHTAHHAVRALDTGAHALWSANRPRVSLARRSGQLELSVAALGERASLRVTTREASLGGGGGPTSRMRHTGIAFALRHVRTQKARS